MNGTWYFPTTGGGDDDGINDAGLEQFEGDRERFVTRECIQNSLDARIDNGEPVVVEFSKFGIPKMRFPGISELNNVIKFAQAYSSGQERSNALYSNALEDIQQEIIQVLKISDYNTTGLEGDDKDTTGDWYRLVRSNGASSMSGDGGGSFGIGKSAPFAASAFRTVFYSTKTGDGGVAFQGKARLSSFEYKGDIKRGIGQYGILIGENKGTRAFREPGLIPDIFERKEQGTDIYIMGYKSKDDWSKKIAKAVLDNFWMAIREKILEIVIKDENQVLVTVNAETLDSLMEQYMGEAEMKLYYDATKNPTKQFNRALPLLGEVELYVGVGAGAKSVLGMRRSLMKIDTLSRLRVLPEDFVGVVVVRGKEGNQNLRMLEPPAHDKWDNNRGDSTNKQALKNLRGYVISCLKEIAEKQSSNVEEIPDLGKYLPEDIADDDRDTVFFGEGVNDASDDSTEETATERGVAQKDTSTEIGAHEKERVAPIIKPGAVGGKHKKASSQHEGKGSGGGDGVSEAGGDTKYADTSHMSVRSMEVNRRGRRIYVLKITPEIDDSGAIRIVAYGDGEDFPMEVASAKYAEGGQCRVSGSMIAGLTFKAGQQLELEVELASSRRYVVGVK